MTLEQAIAEHLLQDATISEHIGERIFTGGMPEGDWPYPAITMMVAYEASYQTNQGLTNARDALLRLDVWTDDYATSRILIEAIRLALVGRVVANDSIRVGTITEDDATIIAPLDPDLLWHGSIDLSTPYRMRPTYV